MERADCYSPETAPAEGIGALVAASSALARAHARAPHPPTSAPRPHSARNCPRPMPLPPLRTQPTPAPSSPLVPPALAYALTLVPSTAYPLPSPSDPLPDTRSQEETITWHCPHAPSGSGRALCPALHLLLVAGEVPGGSASGGRLAQGRPGRQPSGTAHMGGAGSNSAFGGGRLARPPATAG